jgi:hypothetical protein
MRPRVLDGELVEAFARDGVACLRQMLNRLELQVASQAVEIAVPHNPRLGLVRIS